MPIGNPRDVVLRNAVYTIIVSKYIFRYALDSRQRTVYHFTMKSDWLKATTLGDCHQVMSLLKADADINSLDKHGQTALMNAARRGDTELVELLVENGANLNHAAKYRLTALMLAVINGHKDVVQILVNAGADTSLKGSHSSFAKTPLEYALTHGFDEIAVILKDYS